MQRRYRIAGVIAVIGALAVVTGCSSNASSGGTGAATLEGGIKLPGAAPAAATTHGVTTVNVIVSDQGAAGPMTLTATPATAPAGDVTFVVKNTGTIEHEAVVLKTNTAYNKLPITYGGDPPVPTKTGADKVSEDANIGETGDPNLKPGDTRTFKIANMTAGQYAIVCNIAGHYGKGMRAPLTIG